MFEQRLPNHKSFCKWLVSSCNQNNFAFEFAQKLNVDYSMAAKIRIWDIKPTYKH